MTSTKNVTKVDKNIKIVNGATYCKKHDLKNCVICFKGSFGFDVSSGGKS